MIGLPSLHTLGSKEHNSGGWACLVAGEKAGGEASRVWNIIIASNDYRGLGPVLMTDPNKEPLRG
jgi:hypothetical protein